MTSIPTEFILTAFFEDFVVYSKALIAMVGFHAIALAIIHFHLTI